MNETATLITGSNGGVGQFITKYLLEKGHRNLVCHYRSKNDQVITLLKAFDLDPAKHSVQADLSDENSISRMAQQIQINFKFVEKVVNVAGSSTNALSWKMTKQDFMHVLEDNLLTSFLCSKEFIPNMREQKRGRIVNFSSIVGFTGVAGAAHYCAAKAGLVGLTKSISLELASKGITVNAIALGYFNAGLLESVPAEMKQEILKKIPMGRFGTGQDIGAAVEYLLSDSAQFFTGQVLHLNGGQY
ncbi:MAG TPA: SDR family oxidoreductase [Pseudobdellovibrionaceae bacterium]